MEKNVILKWTMENRLMQAPDNLKFFYSDLRNELCSRKKVHQRFQKTCDGYKYKGNWLAKIVINGNNLKLFLPLNPSDYDPRKYHHKDMSKMKKHIDTPFMMKITSSVSVRKAKELIDIVLDSYDLPKVKNYQEVNFFVLYPYIENAVFEIKK